MGLVVFCPMPVCPPFLLFAKSRPIAEVEVEDGDVRLAAFVRMTVFVRLTAYVRLIAGLPVDGAVLESEDVGHGKVVVVVQGSQAANAQAQANAQA